MNLVPGSREFQRKQLLAQPYPKEWEPFLTRNIGQYAWLSPDQRARLRNDARILVEEKRWEGCDGLSMTAEIQVTIAGQVALMLLGLRHDYFSRVLSIVVFPTEFEVPREDEDAEATVLGGQSSDEGAVFLSWDAVLEEGRDPSLGDNLVIHEFAHQLDFLDGYCTGTPALRSREQTVRWRRVMTQEFARLTKDLAEDRETFLGDYAGTHASEFFAVASERFFTLPEELQRYHPSLHAVLSEYYGVDSMRWFEGREPK